MKIFNFDGDFYYKATDVDLAMDKLKNLSDSAWKRGFNVGGRTEFEIVRHVQACAAAQAEEFLLHETRMTEAMVSLEDQLCKSQQDVLLLSQWRDKVFDKHPNIDLDIE